MFGGKIYYLRFVGDWVRFGKGGEVRELRDLGCGFGRGYYDNFFFWFRGGCF